MGERGPAGPKSAKTKKHLLSHNDTLRLLARLYLRQRCLWNLHHSAYFDKVARYKAVAWIVKKGEAGGGQSCKRALLKLRRDYRRFLTRAVQVSPADVTVMLSRAPTWLRDIEAGTGAAWAAAGGAPEDRPAPLAGTATPPPLSTTPSPATATSSAPAPPRPVILPSRKVSGHAPPTAQVAPVQQVESVFEDFPDLQFDLDELYDTWPCATSAPLPAASPIPAASPVLSLFLPEQQQCAPVTREDAARGMFHNMDDSALAPAPAPSPLLSEQHQCSSVTREDAARGMFRNMDDSAPAPSPLLPEQLQCPLVIRVDEARGVWRTKDGSLLVTSAPLQAESPTYWTPPPDPPRLLLVNSADDPLRSLRPAPARAPAPAPRPPPLVRVGAHLYRRLCSSPPTYARVVTLAWSEDVVRRALSEPGVLNYVYREREPLVPLPPSPHSLITDVTPIM